MKTRILLFAWMLAVAAMVHSLRATNDSTAAAATNEWWAFKPLTRATNGSVDGFIAETLRRHQLTLAPEADRRTLIRRLYFNVTGLPPTPEQVAAFGASKDVSAYDRVVEQLLASPRYGEAWARHWLDVVRFAESHGFEMNQPRPNAWPYRDYVIRAFNEDKPYDQFVMEQIAGDALGVDEATGFLVGGSWDQVKSPDPVLTANQRADELHDIVSTTGSAFLGLTVGCARCHNHKFDPIPQREYFAVRAVFEGVQHGERKRRDVNTAARQEELSRLRQRLGAIESELERSEPLATPGSTNAVRSPVNPRKNVERFAPVTARKVRFTVLATTDAEPCIDELEVYATGAAPTNIALAANGTTARASTVFPNSDIHRLEHVNDGIYGNGRSWISNERGKGWVELTFREPATIDRIVWGRDREQRYTDRLAVDYRIEAEIASNEWRSVATSEDRHRYARKGNSTVAAADLTNAVQKLLAERAQLERRVADLASVPMVYAGIFVGSPPTTHRLHRGDPMQKREPIEPAALSALPVAFALNSAASTNALTEDQRRRLAFARWLTSPENPLTARVMVNRIWQFHFGEGLVSSPSDFGANGAKPTHPELLDWLAGEFIAHGWSVKHIQRLILTSQTFRQASARRDEALRVDAGSRLLWRFPPRRLEAEAIRDSILAVSGKLDLRMGGPGFSFFEPNDNYVRVYVPRRTWPAETFRRMIYGTVIRQRVDGVFGAFDCPDAGQIAPKRSRSTTPLQALNLLNSSFIMQQAEFFARRVAMEAGQNIDAQVRRAFELAFQRAPEPDEAAAAAELIRTEGARVFCRALFNANEFIHLD